MGRYLGKIHLVKVKVDCFCCKKKNAVEISVEAGTTKLPRKICPTCHKRNSTVDNWIMDGNRRVGPTTF